MFATWIIVFQDFAGAPHERIVNIRRGETAAHFVASDFGPNLPFQEGPSLGCGKHSYSPKGAILQLLNGRKLVSAFPNTGDSDSDEESKRRGGAW